MLLCAAGVALSACAAGPRTEFHALPPDADGFPPRGHAIYAAVLPGVVTRIDGEVYDVGPDLARSYARILRRAAVFTEISGPGSAAGPGHARLTLETDVRIDPNTDANLSRSVLRGASLSLLRQALPYEVDVTGEMVLRVRLPGTGEERAYTATTRASRTYADESRYRPELDVLTREITRANLRSIIAQMRADPALTAETAPGRDPFAGGS